MAAQGSEKKFNICDRCFASVPSALSACPECGAPMHLEQQGAAEQGDAQVYQELARANLLRMRGDYLGAEAECLKILRRFPNNASAHTLLGDIYGEKGDPEQALQWYELSADLVSDGAVTEKIASTQRRIAEREQANTAKELGLPAERSQKAKFVFSILVPVVVVFIAAYALGRRQAQDPPSPKSRVVAPISAPGHDPTPEELKDGKSTDPNSAGSDVVLLERIKSSTADGANLLLSLQDPRTKDVTLSYLTEEDKQIRPMGARLASAALDVVPDALLVTVRAMRGGNVVYVANVHRARLNETKQPTWQNDNRDNPTAWIDYVLEFEWSNSAKARPATDGTPPSATEQQPPLTGQEPAESSPDAKGAAGAPSEQPATTGTPPPAEHSQEAPPANPKSQTPPATTPPTG